MKTKLTKDDPAGWYACTWLGRDYCRYWDGKRLRLDPCGMDCVDQYTNFRRLVEYVEPEIIEGDGVTVLPRGTYWAEHKSKEPYVQFQPGDCRGERSSRYIRIPAPVFPPREEPDPPRPELVLVKVNGVKEWAFKVGDLFRFGDGKWMPVKHAEIIKSTE